MKVFNAIALLFVFTYAYSTFRSESIKDTTKELQFKIDSLKCQKTCLCKMQIDTISDAEAIKYIKKNKPKFVKL